MFKNPLIRRYRYSLMRPAQFWVYTSIYISILFLMLLINYSLYDFQRVFKTLEDLHVSLYTQLLFIQCLLLLIWAAFNSSSAISLERSERTYDFFRILPMPAYQKMLGILAGKNLVVLLLASINLVFLLFYAYKAQIGNQMLFQTLFALFSTALLFNTGGLLISLCAKGKNKGSKIGGIILLVIFGMPLLINSMMALSQLSMLQGKTATFYTLRLPILVLIGSAAIYYTIWNIIGILRRMNKEDQPLFSRFGALLFLAAYYAFVIGLLFPHVSVVRNEMLAAFWWLTLIPALIVPYITFFKTENYLELSASYRRKNLSRAKTLVSFLFISNLSIAAVLFAIWVIAVYVIKLYYKIYIPNLTHIVLVIASFYLFLMLLLEITKTYDSEHGKIFLLAGFIAAAYLILPPIFASIFEKEAVAFYSPAGFLFMVLTRGLNNVYSAAGICLYNLLLSVIPAILIIRRYIQILSPQHPA
ncbi:MAG: hypothetical protein WCZ89_07775 [Phycisphaerae bacterium]